MFIVFPSSRCLCSFSFLISILNNLYVSPSLISSITSYFNLDFATTKSFPSLSCYILLPFFLRLHLQYLLLVFYVFIFFFHYHTFYCLCCLISIFVLNFFLSLSSITQNISSIYAYFFSLPFLVFSYIFSVLANFLFLFS